MARMKLLVCLLAFVAQSDMAVPVSSGWQSNALGTDVLDRSVRLSGGQDLSTAQAFSAALVSVGAAGGLVKVEGCEPSIGVTHKWREKSASLRVFLDAIVGEDRLYKWELTDGAIYLVPSSGDPELLRTKINHIELKNVVLTNAIGQILDLPEVRKSAAELGLTSGFVTLQGLASLGGRPTFNLSCKNVTVRQALNAAALAEGRGIWVYTERHCGGKHEYTVDVRAE